MLDGLVTLPSWLVTGLVLGVASSVAIAGLFVAIVRLFPTRGPSQSSDTEARRRSEIRAYLDGIGERYVENHVVAGQSVAFYLPGRAVAITFDARVYFRLVGTDTTPVLVEHELPGVAIGPRLPFETPGSAPSPGSNSHPASEAFARLGLPAGAPLADVRDAYRQKVKEVHPDQGGDEAAFRRVREAYTTARQHATD
ncbi:DnaJ-class molecular chaperone [Halapricum desulfuricans]|uniref:DnaJ-class molecular chaperone n=1 Tax=Halapricum desulfuricans TaxID=2841257 RepID=A0A897NKN8_9EURY|nr:J domain-containing protein [Halapricum desulfuricans]QSG11513.1 DnaJ-class molecular chaperone [Halapricum desulfuricans]